MKKMSKNEVNNYVDQLRSGGFAPLDYGHVFTNNHRLDLCSIDLEKNEIGTSKKSSYQTIFTSSNFDESSWAIEPRQTGPFVTHPGLAWY